MTFVCGSWFMPPQKCVPLQYIVCQKILNLSHDSHMLWYVARAMHQYTMFSMSTVGTEVSLLTLASNEINILTKGDCVAMHMSICQSHCTTKNKYLNSFMGFLKGCKALLCHMYTIHDENEIALKCWNPCPHLCK